MDVEMYLNPNAGSEESLYLADPAVAKEGFVQAAVLSAALDRAAIAEGILMSHARTGHSRIEVEPAGEPDILVSLADPREDKNGGAAMGIERETDALSTAFGLKPIRDLYSDDNPPDLGPTFGGG